MVEITSRWKSVADKERWAARGASFVAKLQATKKAASTTTGAAKKSAGAANKTTAGAKKVTNPVRPKKRT